MITDLIANGHMKIEELRKREQEAERERAAEREAEIALQEAELAGILTLNFPEDLQQYIGLCTDLPVQQGDDAHYRIEAPECTAVLFKIHRKWMRVDDQDGYHFTGLGKFRPHEYSQDRDCYTFQVEEMGVVLDEEKGYITAPAGTRRIDDFEIALAYSNLQHQRIAGLQAEADQKNQQRAEKQARAQALELQQNIAQAKTDEQLAEMMDDPIMGPLLNLVNSIVQERADMNQRISDLHEAMESSEYYHSEAIGRLEKRVSDEARRRSEAEREAENTRYEVTEAEDKLRKATKKTGVWG